jgi:hypothetical protein
MRRVIGRSPSPDAGNTDRSQPPLGCCAECGLLSCVAMRTFLFTAIVLLGACSPRTWVKLNGAGEELRQMDLATERLFEARAAARATPTVENAGAFAEQLRSALRDRGLVEYRKHIAEPLDVPGLLADALQALETAARAQPAGAGPLHFLEAALYQATQEPQKARAAADLSMQVSPSYGAFHFLTAELDKAWRPDGAALERLCAAVRPQIHYVTEVGREEREAVLDEIVDFIDRCHGVCAIDNGPVFCDWVSAKEAQHYRATKQVWKEVDEEYQAKSNADTQAFFREGCLRRCDDVYVKCQESPAQCLAQRRYCGSRCN